MAIIRGPDGIPVDVPSVVKKDRKQSQTENTNPKISVGGIVSDDVPTLSPSDNRAGPSDSNIGRDNMGSGSLFPEDPPTAPPKRASAMAQADVSVPDDPPTVVNRGRSSAALKSTKVAATGVHSNNAVPDEAMADPVSGWLVVVNGPGKGHYVKLGFGQNSIGRSPNERVTVDFGDSQLSRSNHAMVTYDPRGNRFYIQQGSGTNLAYVNDAPVLAPMALEPFSHILLGDTTLRFVPLCCEDFTWD